MAANTANLMSLSIDEVNALYPVPNSTLTTDMSVAPYYDDYDKTKGYYRVLYRPGYAVQARELTQSQTLLQKQVSRFGQHIFKEGSIVLPGEFSIETDVDYIKIKDVDSQNNTVQVSDYINATLESQSGIKAFVIEALDGNVDSANTKTFYVRYTSSATSNTQLKTFITDETISVTSGMGDLNSVVTIDEDAVGKGSRFVIREGVIFAKDHFIWFPTQSIILDRYSRTPSARVGFTIFEEIVRYTDDASLLDPALESSNYAGPGADRLKLTCKLVTKDYDDTEGSPDFVELFTIKDGIVTELYSRSQYNILRDEFAKRTLDESGDYYVRGLSVRVRENLNVNNNGGYDENGSANLLSIGVEPGTAYVKGYEVNKLVTEYVTVEKPVYNFGNVESAAATASMGSYITCNEFLGPITVDTGSVIFLRDRFNKQLSNATFNDSKLGGIIGTARVKGVEYESGTLGTPSGTISLYLMDIRMNGTNSFANVRSVHTTDMAADVVQQRNRTVLKESGTDSLLYYTGAIATRSVKSKDGISTMDYDFKRTATQRGVVNGLINFQPTFQPDEEFPYQGSTVLKSSEKRNILITLETDETVNTGTKVVNASANLITGDVGSYFTSKWQVGDKIILSDNARPYRITSIVSDRQIYIDGILPSANAGNTIYKSYKKGDIIDLTSVGVASGDVREVTGTATALSFDFKEDLNTTITITYPVNVSGAKQIPKRLVSNCFVAIDCSKYLSEGKIDGPYSLGFSDVYRINKILRRTDSTIPTGLGDTTATDVTQSFNFDNGQRDSFYDTSTIKPDITLGVDDRLLVCFDYFDPDYSSGQGFFTIDSYPINDSETFDATANVRTETIPVYFSPTSGQRYDLRNYIDFRPMKADTATQTSIPGSATDTPGFANSFKYFSTTALRLPSPSARFDYDYSYYLPRKDLVVLDRDGGISIIKGVVSPNPVTPQTPPNAKALASIFVPPYPSLAPNYAQIIGRTDLACIVKKLAYIRYTMRDIGILKNRIVNLEYYASLNALQTDASQMAILDENGLNRFKNGIFCDTFSDHTFGDVRNADYRIIVDQNEKSIRPVYTMHSFYYNYIDQDNAEPGESSSHVQLTGDLVTLPYSEVPLIEQKVVTSFRNVELSTYRFIGKVFCDPEIDVWCDTNYIADNQITFGPSANNLPENETVWGEWQRKILGYTVDPYPHDARINTNGPGGSWTYFDPNKIFGFTTTSNYPRLPLISSPNSPRDQKVTMTYEESRTGTETTYSLEESSISLGEKVVDVAIQPYIRPQTIDVNVKGMKAFTKVYVFFDGEDMTDWCAPLTLEEYLQTPEQRSANSLYYLASSCAIGNNGELVCYPNDYLLPGTYWLPRYGAEIVTDETGEAYFALTIPSGTAIAPKRPDDGMNYVQGGPDIPPPPTYPYKKFTVGRKEVVVTDSPTNSTDATTYAKGYFTAQGLIQQKQDTILTTRSITSNTHSVYEKSTEKTIVGYIDNPSCTAYSFIPKAPDGEEGIFLTSVDVWFARKHPTLGVWFEVRAMDSAGGITRTQVPLSEVWLTAEDIKVSPNGIDSPTKVTFPSPIFLYNNTQYAFVMHTVGLNPEAYVWISRLGETDINTGKKHNARPLTGTFFTTNNNMNWNIVDDIDLRIKFYRAKFDISREGVAYFGNSPQERLVANTEYQVPEILSDLRLITPPIIETDVAPPISIIYGEVFDTQTITVKSTTNIDDYEEGDELIDEDDANCRSKIIKVDKPAKKIHLANPTALFNVNKNLKRNKASGRPTQGLTQAIESITKSKAKAKKHKTHKWKANCGSHLTHVHKSGKSTLIDFEITMTKRFANGKTITINVPDETSSYGFTPGSYAISQISNSVIEIIDIKDFRYSTVDFEPTYLSYKKTGLLFEMRPTSNTKILQPWHNIVDGKNYFYDEEMAVLCRSSEIIDLGGKRSNKIRATLSSMTDFLSPVIDVARIHSVYVDNLINANTAATANVYQSYPLECGPSGGEIVNKYISTPITLADGQDAEDLLLMITSYKPPGTDVLVFGKFLNGEDSDTLASKSWIPLELQGEAYSSLSDRGDFKELTYRIPASYLTGPPDDNGPGGEFQYTNSTGVLFEGYKYFQIKIALTSPNSAIVPRVSDLRAIALQI